MGLLAGHRDAVEGHLEGIYWTAVWSLGVFYAVAAIVFAVRYVHRLWQRWTILREKARDHDRIAANLDRWKVAAARATARADDAERRIATWNRDTLEEGRRRLLAELRAHSSETVFTKMDCGEDGHAVLIGAQWNGDIPPIDARYVLRSAILKDIKAVLELQAIRADRIVVFRVESVKSSAYRSSLISQAHGERAFPSDLEIVPREESDLGKEPLWPEN